MTPIINLSHISYNYEEVSALNDISLEIYAGELIFFTGPNGCGKPIIPIIPNWALISHLLKT